MRRFAGLILALALLPLPGAAQDRAQTLADIRAELGTLAGEIGALRSELVTTGALSQAGGSTMLERIESIEGELVRLTSRTEDLEFRLNRIVTDGTNRLGDLEFRIVELEGGDVSALSATPTLGGGDTAPAGANATPSAPKPETAVGEQADFDRARAVLGQGDFRTAADLFAAYAQTWAQGPLTGEALLLRGEALEALGETSNAARAYLESFSGYPQGPRAPEALLRLGQALGRLGQDQEACLTLTEVGTRYPDSPAATEAVTAMQGLGCS